MDMWPSSLLSRSTITATCTSRFYNPGRTPLPNRKLIMEDLAPSEKLLDSILDWLDQGGPDRLHLQNIHFENFEKASSKLSALGFKLRFDWDSESRTIVARRPTELHEVPGGWFVYELAILVNQKLSQVSICGRPSVSNMGSTELPVGKEGSSVVPDQSLYLMQVDANASDVFVSDTPRVVFETSTSEQRHYIIEKIFKYLFETSGVHAVIICDLTNVPPRMVRETESGTQPAKPFKAEIAVWSRKATGSVGSDCPLDPCYHHTESTSHKVGNSTDPASVSGFEQSHTDASSLALDEFDHSAREYVRPDPNNPGKQQRIFRRSPEWITVCDESVPSGEEELILDVYDFLRPCSQHPDSYIQDRDIVVPLTALRSRLTLALERRRNSSQQNFESAKAESSTHQLARGRHRRDTGISIRLSSVHGLQLGPV